MKPPTDAYDVYYDDHRCHVVMRWNGYSTSQQFKEGTELMLTTLIAHKCRKVLADIKEMTLIGSSDQRWLESMFIPKARAAGMMSLAIVTPRNYFNRIAVETVSLNVTQNGFKIEFFDKIEDAQLWLDSV